MSEAPDEVDLSVHDALTQLRQLTAARVSLGRSGTSVRTQDHLAFQLDHASARDAVQMELDGASLNRALLQAGWSVLNLQTPARDTADVSKRKTYLQRPDLGRRLTPESAATVRKAAAGLGVPPEVVFAIADGLSPRAVESNAVPLLQAMQPLLNTHGWSSDQVCVVQGGRVAAGDEIGALFGASIAIMLIGERPGLSASDSMGIYLTWAPRVGRTDAERNCISNVRSGGLSHGEAAERLLTLMNRARALQRSGVELQGGAHAAALLP